MTTSLARPKPLDVDPAVNPSSQGASIDRIFDAEFSYVCHSLRRLGVRRADQEDLAHDVFVVVMRHLGDYDPARPLRPWLFGIAFRVALDHRRRARHQREVQGAEVDPADEAPGADEQLAAAQNRQLVAQALGSVELERRAVFVLHDLEGHPMREIALALELPVNTASSRLRLAREEFRTAVERIRLRRGER